MKKLGLLTILFFTFTTISLGQTAQEYLDRGIQAYKNKQYSAAIPLFTQAITLSPNTTAAWYNRGQAYYYSGNLDLAIADYSQAIKINPNYLDALFQRGLANNKKNNHDAAIADYSRGLQLSPNDPQFWYNRGIAYMDKENFDAALADYNQALKLNPNYVKAFVNRGSVYYKKKQYELAIADLTTATKLDPTYAEAWGNRGVCYNSLNQPDLAITDFNQALKVDANYAKAYLDRGIAYNKKKQNDLAIADLTQAIKLNPNFVGAYLMRGAIYYDTKKYDLAKLDMEKVLQLSPGNKLATDVLARINGTSSAATPSTPSPVAANPNSVEGYLQKAQSQYLAKQMREAATTATACLAAFPNSVPCYSARGEIYTNIAINKPLNVANLRTNTVVTDPDWLAAVADLTKTIELAPNNADYYYRRAFIYYRSDGYKIEPYEAGIADLKKALELNPNHVAAKALVPKLNGHYASKLFSNGNNKVMQGQVAATQPGKAKESVDAFNDAINHLTKAISYQKSELYLKRRGEAYLGLKKYDLAIADYTEAIKVKPDNGEAYNLRAAVYVAQKNLTAALADYDKVISLPDNAETKFPKLEALVQRGNQYRETGKLDLAIADYTKVLAIMPDHQGAFYGRGLAYFKKGDAKTAEADFQKILAASYDPEAVKKDLGANGIPPYNKLYPPSPAKKQ